MTRPPVHLALLFVGCLGCAAGRVPIDFEIGSDPAADPYTGATELAVILEEGGLVRDEVVYPIDAVRGDLGFVAEGLGYVLRVETRAGDVVLARGRSFPFELVLGDDPPVPDVFLGRLGIFSLSSDDAPPATNVLGVVATDAGALFITEDGSVVEYVAHDRTSAGSRDARTRLVATVADATSYDWVGLARGRLLAVGGPSEELRLFDATGELLPELPGPGATSLRRTGASLTAVDGGEAALLVGGIPFGAVVETDAVTRITMVDGASGPILSVIELMPLPSPRTDASGLSVVVRGGASCPCERVLVFGGSAGGAPLVEASLVDPTGSASPWTAALPSAPPGAALAAMDTGLVAVIGGTDALGVAVADVTILAVTSGQLDVLSPPHPPLFGARTGAAATVIGDGLVMVYGGVGPTGSALSTVELIEFPGDVAPTGSLPAPIGSPVGVRLLDQSVLVLGPGVESVFVVPRNP